jgi:ATP-dependent 26S proteasome regulatory subunit
MSGFRTDLSDLVRARFPLLYVQTWEEQRVLVEVWDTLRSDRRFSQRPRALYVWTSTNGLAEVVGMDDGERPVDRPVPSGQPRESPAHQPHDPMAMLAWIRDHDSSAVVLAFDFHRFLRPVPGRDEQLIVRGVRDLATRLKTGSVAKTLVLVAPTLVIPDELQKDVTIVDFPLPDETQIEQALHRLLVDNRRHAPSDGLSEEDRRHLVKAALGLTKAEAENAFARALASRGRLDRDAASLVRHEKRQAVRRTGVLDYMEQEQGFADIGGLDVLRGWLRQRSRAWLDDRTLVEYRLPFPKGVLITGVPGCGKSLTAKCTSVEWGLPLLRLDMGRVFERYVGSSEENLRTAIRVAEAVAPCILFIDEVEKGMSGGTGGPAADSGVARRLFGTFLTWLQEKTKPVFVIATANDITALPPEFLRKGRFDEIFFVDLPDLPERARIWQIYLEKLRLSPRAIDNFPLGDGICHHLAERTAGYSGAEIEQALNDALFRAYAELRALTVVDIEGVLAATHPLAETSRERIEQLREWARQRAVPASTRENVGGGRSDQGPPDFREPATGRVVDVSGV